MAGTKVDPPPLDVPLIDSRGYPTPALREFMHKLWKRTGGADDNDEFIVKMLSAGAMPKTQRPSTNPEPYRYQPPHPPLAHEAIEQAQLAAMLALTPKPSSFDQSDLEKGKVPIGGILLWSGAVADIPGDYALCDGTNGTPDVSNLFIRAVTADADIGTTGGAEQAAGVTTESNTTGVTLSNTTQGATAGSDFNALDSASTNDPGHTHDVTVDTVPPYYAMALIMRIR